MHQCFKLNLKLEQDERSSRVVFIKVNKAKYAHILKSEFDSLVRLTSFSGLAYPAPLLFDHDQTLAVLVMVFYTLSSLTEDNGANLGALLARHHQHQGTSFGWQQDNYIGLTPQQNDFSESWPVFFRDCRLLPQLRLAEKNGLDAKIRKQLECLMGRIESHLVERKTVPCLLHGDLWSGNAAYDQLAQRAILVDPAPYYGDPEVDLAMTELFGRFPDSFYSTYDQISPIDQGYIGRRPIYNLYHALNHFNLFGEAYVGLVARLITEIDNQK